MPSMNKVVLIGRLTRDPELRYTAGGLAVTTFSIAVDRRFKNQQGERVTDFFRCKAWRQKAEFVANYITKGRLVAVEGSIEISEVPGQDGQRRTFVDIVCENVETLDGPRDAGAGGGAEAPNYGGAARGRAPVEDDQGYYSEDEGQGGPPPRQAAPPQAAPPRAAAAAPPPRPAAPAPANAAPKKPAEPAYPEDDFDDSDPFADE